MNPVDKGLILEQLYREKLMNKLVGETQVKEDLADRIMYGTDNQNSLDLMMNKPVYEELRQIPINEQLKMMNDNFNTLPEKKDKTNENLRNAFPLYKGERLS